ncbi:hypothetical protein [Maribacter sp. 2304DJ31-5]|uniref:hypothetical protein n=1 Tax=Maribacter sp. 2304DJ31-5 TaxID=3386273 RepID=UPI0039BC373C
MTKTTTNLLLMLIAILAGTYFYVMYCSECSNQKSLEPEESTEARTPTEPVSTFLSATTNNGNYSPIHQNGLSQPILTSFSKNDTETLNSRGLVRTNISKNHQPIKSYENEF